MRIHLIAIGGSIMHNLALCLHRMGHEVTGSDDVIYDPARGRLEKAGLLPSKMGWHEKNISREIDLVILGMHAKPDNVELAKARELNLKIQSFPEFVGEQSVDKTRLVVAGSHGKTTTSSMLLHALAKLDINTDYLVGAQLKGFDLMVRLTEESNIIVLEGDEYLSSALDRRSKFLHYDPDVCILTGLDWDHVNVFPTYDSYLSSFKDLLGSMRRESTLIYNQYDSKVVDWVHAQNFECQALPYVNAEWYWEEKAAQASLENGIQTKFELPGDHNMINAMGALKALQVVTRQGLTDLTHTLDDFEMPDKRLNLIVDSDRIKVYRDFAHAPSKVSASVNAIRKMFPNEKLISILELHTYSSLNKDFLPQYKGCLDVSDEAFVYYNPEALAIKRMPPISSEIIVDSFGAKDLRVCTEPLDLYSQVSGLIEEATIILLMSSSNFGGLDWLRLQD